MIKKEFEILWSAIAYFTRIPLPKGVNISQVTLSQSNKYLTFIGWLVGGVGALVVWVLSPYLSQSVSVVLALGTMILLTGAFHEDAIADFCDGFGGGYSKEQILTIMKDSRVGVYGAVGTVMFLLTKYVVLTEIDVAVLPLVLLSSHAFSRLLPVVIIYTSNYVSLNATSKAKPVAEHTTIGNVLIALLFGVAPLLIFHPKTIVAMLVVQAVLLLYYRYYIHKKIGGYTGDVLGALQQISEVVSYLVFLAVGCKLANGISFVL